MSAIARSSLKVHVPLAVPAGEFEQLIAAANATHQEITAIVGQPTREELASGLEKGFAAGQALSRARAIHRQRKKEGETALGWIKAVEEEVAFTYATVCNYIRLHENQSRLLRELPLGNRSIRSAIRHLGPTQTRPRRRKRKQLPINRREFIALARRYGIEEFVKNPDSGLAFVNAVGLASGMTKEFVWETKANCVRVEQGTARESL